jgi:hypothetical protein
VRRSSNPDERIQERIGDQLGVGTRIFRRLELMANSDAGIDEKQLSSSSSGQLSLLANGLVA